MTECCSNESMIRRGKSTGIFFLNLLYLVSEITKGKGSPACICSTYFYVLWGRVVKQEINQLLANMTENYIKMVDTFHTGRVLSTCLENYTRFIHQTSLVHQQITASPLLPIPNGYQILLIRPHLYFSNSSLLFFFFLDSQINIDCFLSG